MSIYLLDTTLARVRLGRAILLTFGCEIDGDLKHREVRGPQRTKNWHIAPIFDLSKIPADARMQDEESGETLLLRDIVTGNRSASYFYLEPLPDTSDNLGHYVDLRKLTPISVEYVIAAKEDRLAALNEDAVNGCLNQLMWFFTRARILREPISCPQCGGEVNVNEVLVGQELDLDSMQ